jgi:SAM-dependent methyltransferase
MTVPACPLCADRSASLALESEGRAYHQCTRCDLIFLEPSHRLRPLAEVMRYLEHNNDAGDAGYMAFLQRLGAPVLSRLAAGARGLDFGCGPATALGDWFTANGHPTASYDPLFHPDDALLAAQYDFVTCSEVVEHAHDPAAMFTTLGALLRPGGLLGVMTRFHGVEASFERWWYRRDPTHICFFSARTMQWVADRHGWQLELPAPHVALFTIRV